jgi:hypothetical protein
MTACATGPSKASDPYFQIPVVTSFGQVGRRFRDRLGRTVAGFMHKNAAMFGGLLST